MNDDFWALRHCCQEPIPEIFEAASLLNDAMEAHLSGNTDLAFQYFKKADLPILANWTESLWGPQKKDVHRLRTIENLPPLIKKETKLLARMPDSATKKKVIERDGYHCRYCGIPVIRQEVRNRIQKFYPDALKWGRSNKNQHSAFQCLWLTYEHVVPHSRGGDNSYENVIISCQACNCAKMNFTIEEMGLIDPRTRQIQKSSWDGLERFR